MFDNEHLASRYITQITLRLSFCHKQPQICPSSPPIDDFAAGSPHEGLHTVGPRAILSSGSFSDRWLQCCNAPLHLQSCCRCVCLRETCHARVSASGKGQLRVSSMFQGEHQDEDTLRNALNLQHRGPLSVLQITCPHPPRKAYK